MKKISLIFFIIVWFNVFSQKEQALKVTYGKKANLTIDSTKVRKNQNTTGYYSMINLIVESMNKIQYTLLIGKEYAKFEYDDILQEENFKKTAISFGGGQSHFYDLEKNKVYFYNHNKDKLVEYEEDAIIWNITNETKKIDGFLCFKALGKAELLTIKDKKGLEYEAWFCPDFNSSCGPSQFFGLPGLIFEATIINSGVLFYLKKIEYTNDSNILIPKKPIISIEENNIEMKQLIQSIREEKLK